MLLSIFALLMGLFQGLPVSPEKSLWNSNGQNFDRYQHSEQTTRIIQSENGMLWIGTRDGVISFDGYRTHQYSESLADTVKQYFIGAYVTSVFEDSNNNIWVAAGSGSWNLLPKGASRFINFVDLTGTTDLTAKESIIELKDGRILSNSNQGLHFLSFNNETGEKTYKVVTYEELGRNKRFNKLFKGQNGKIYAVSDGLYELTINENDRIEIRQILQGNDSWHFYQIDDDKYFLSDKIDGQNVLRIYHEDGELKEHVIPFLNTEGRRVQSILRDSRDNYWVISNNGVITFKLDQFDEIQHVVNYRIGNVRDIIEDKSGNIFFTSSVGLLKLNWNYEQYEYISLPDELSNSYVFKYHTDTQGNYWIGHNRGLLKYDVLEKTFSVIEESGRAYSIAEDRDKNIWIGDPQSLRIFDHLTGDLIHDFESGHTYNITFDHENNAWFINNGVLSRVKNGERDIEQLQIGQNIYRMLIDENDLWVQTANFEIRNYEVTKDGSLNLKKSLVNEFDYQVNWMEGDLIGNLWLSSTRGVLVINKESGEVVEILNRENILGEDDVFEIIRDQSGIMWVKASAIGSTAINPNTIESVTFTPTWLAQPGRHRGYFCVNAVGSSGKLFTDGIGGFFVFHPDSLSKNPYAPDILLEEAVVNNSMRLDSDHRLSHDENDLEFSFLGIQFDNSERNEYAYYLEGIDDDWSFVKNERVANYLSLPTGEYTFYVKAANSDMVWSEPKALASFSILPPWYANTWAYSIYLLLVGLITFFFYKAQLNKRLAESEAHRLKEVDEFKTRFFTNISHEFRTPLTVILGLAERINHESSAVIIRNATKLLELINQILELSKVEANQATIRAEKFDVVEYVNYQVHSLETLAHERGIGLTFKSIDEMLFVELDRQKLDLILHNLLSNALKFTEKDGRVTVRLETKNNHLIIRVIDTGVGIKEEAINQIFNRFFQSDAEEHRYEGTGIGLSLTNELVNLLGGTITVESKIGVGSTFTVALPCSFVDKEEVVEEKTDLLIKTAQKITSPDKAEVVLLVEDNYDVRSFIKEILSEEYKVLVAHNGKEGFRIALEEIPDIILTDVMMPYKDGLELTEDLKLDERTSHIPIIMLTAKADVESRLSGLKTGADVYLSKPFNEQELKVHIQNLIGLREKIRARYSGEIEQENLSETIEDQFVLKIHDSILSNLDDEEFGIEELCRAIGVSRTQLHRKLESINWKVYLYIYSGYPSGRRSKLLRTTQKSVSEIAYEVGFGDPNYFTKLYSEKYAHSPSKEREIVS